MRNVAAMTEAIPRSGGELVRLGCVGRDRYAAGRIVLPLLLALGVRQPHVVIAVAVK